MTETNALEPLRRSMRNTLVLTVVTFGLLPTFSLVQNPGPVRGIGLLAGIVVFVVVHGVRIWRAVCGRWDPLPLWQTALFLGYVIGLSVYALSLDVQSGVMCLLLTGLVTTEFVIGRERRQAWRYIAVAAVVQGLAIALAVLVLDLGGSALLLGLLAAGVVVFTAYCISIAPVGVDAHAGQGPPAGRGTGHHQGTSPPR